ncbi:MAG: hypothetical protein WAV25_00265 [Minisyncoccia bacterium]
MTKENLKIFSRGFTFAELIIGVAIIMLFVSGIYNAYYSLYGSILASHSKTVAVDLANEEYELIKNLPYSSIGTVGGNPIGVIPTNQSITRDRITFTINTSILYKDDPFDGISGGTPNDTLPNDYKLVEVKVSCTSCKNFNPVVITGRFSPKNLESN